MERNMRTCQYAHAHTDTREDSQFMSVGEKLIDKYLEYLPVEIVALNWAEPRQMRRSKLNK